MEKFVNDGQSDLRFWKYDEEWESTDEWCCDIGKLFSGFLVEINRIEINMPISDDSW